MKFKQLFIFLIGFLPLLASAQANKNAVAFSPVPGVPNLVITEINYNGPESGTDTTEFIEIYNNDTVAVNMAGFSFTKGITYTFPQVVVGVGQYFVIAYDSLKVNDFFNISSYKWTSGGLSNGGEELLLVTSTGDTIDRVVFDDGGSWPTSPDGFGPSLTLCDVNSDNSLAANWSAATTFAGVNAAGDSIFANPGAGCGAGPTPIGDTIAPYVMSATALSDTVVEVKFSEVVDTTALNSVNYTGLTAISTISFQANQTDVHLNLSTALTNGQTYNLTINNVKDTAQNMMDSAQTFAVLYNAPQTPVDSIAPYVMNATALSDTVVEVKFSEVVDTTALNSANYTGLTAISTISFQSNHTDVHLNLSTALTSGQTYNLTINNVKDTAQNGMDSAQTFAILYQSSLPPFSGIPNLVITEINYNGPESGTDTTEFIEIYNNDTVAVNMAGFSITEGVVYTFPQVVLGVGQYFVLSLDSVKVNNFFNISSYKWISGGLSNGGEDLLLVTSTGDTIDYVNFDDGGSWPTSPDGFGPSLTLCDVNSDNSLAANWSAATTFAGVNAAGDSIFANPGAGCGAGPTPVGDTIAPYVMSATALSDTVVEVKFTEVVDTTALNSGNYTGLTAISTISFQANQTDVHLNLSTALTNGQTYNLTINNVKDTAQNMMDSAQTFAVLYNAPQTPVDSIAPYVMSATALSDTVVEVKFSEVVDTTALNSANYTGLTLISTISFQANQTDVHLNLSTALTSGQTYNLTINNVKDTAQNMMDSAQTFAILYQSSLPPFSGIPNLVISEINYNGPESGTDTTEFIEIYNNDTVAVNMAGFSFTKGITYTFPQVVVGVGQYFVIAFDSVKVNNFFNISSYKWTSGGLSNSGEELLLVTSTGDTIDRVVFDDGGSWPTSPDGNGPSLTLCDVNSDNSLAANWSAATTFAGVNAAGDSIFANPGAGCGFVPPPASDTIPPVVLSVTPVNASTIDVVYNEMVDNSATITSNYSGITSISSILLSSNSKTATISLGTPMVNGMNYSLTINTISDTAGNIMTNPQTFNFIFNNSQADLIITEIMYNDLSEIDSLEYFEIYNKGTVNADISGYQVSDGIVYTFPQNTVMAPGSFLVIAKDSALVNSVFGISGTHQWTDGGLKNSGEAIEIVNTNGISVAKVEFSDQSPWPVEADGDGPSLEFCDKNLVNNNGANWTLSTNFVTTFNGDSIFGSPKSDCIPIGISEMENEVSLNIFPNPAHNTVQISSSVEMNQIQVFDANGNQVYHLILNGYQFEIDITSYESGLYFIRTIFANGTLSKSSKLLIIR